MSSVFRHCKHIWGVHTLTEREEEFPQQPSSLVPVTLLPYIIMFTVHWHLGTQEIYPLMCSGRWAFFALLSAADYYQRHTSRWVGANQHLPPEPGARDIKASALWSGNRPFMLDGPWIMARVLLHGTPGVLEGKRQQKQGGTYPCHLLTYTKGCSLVWVFAFLGFLSPCHFYHLLSEWKS